MRRAPADGAAACCPPGCDTTSVADGRTTSRKRQTPDAVGPGRCPRRSVNFAEQLLAGDVGRAVAHLEKPAAHPAAGLRVELGGLVPAGDAGLPARRTVGLESHRITPGRLDSCAPSRSTRPILALALQPLCRVRRHHRRRDCAAPSRSPRTSANVVGPLPEIELPSAPAASAAALASTKPGSSARASRLGDTVVDGAAQQRVVAGGERGHDRATCAAWWIATARGTSARQHRAGVGRCATPGRAAPAPPPGPPAPAARRRRADAWSGSGRSRRAARARCCRDDGRPPSPRPRGRRRAGRRGRAARQQRVDRDGAGHRRGGAAALAAAERQSLPHGERDPAARAARARRRSSTARAARPAVWRSASVGRSGWPGSTMVIPGSSVHSARTSSPAPATARPTMSRPGPTLPTPPARSRGDRARDSRAGQPEDVVEDAGRGHLGAGAGTGDHEGIGLVARGGEDQLVVRPLIVASGLDGRDRAQTHGDLRGRDRSPRSAAPILRRPRASPAAPASSTSGSRSRNCFIGSARAHLGTSDSTAVRESSPV